MDSILTIKKLDGLDKSVEYYKKKWRHEVSNVLSNLETVWRALEDGVHPEQIKSLGFVHSEPKGILAIDESGKGKKGRMKALRLYIYPDLKEQKLYVIRLGDKDKNRQGRDVQFAKECVQSIEQNKIKLSNDIRDNDETQ